MSLGRLGITNIRNIARAELRFSPGINLFFGANGSGKTSLLEAIYFLGSGRTFRGQSADPLIRRETDTATVFGELTGHDGRQHRLGVQRGRDGSRAFRIDGESASRTSSLARLLPTLVLGPQTVELLTGSPQLRRRFLNWGVFHVEPQFVEVWEQYRRVLRQRNRLLKQGNAPARDLRVWTESLSELATTVDEQRSRYFSAFQDEFARVCESIMGEKSVDSRYYRGWEQGRSMADILAAQEDTDRRRGFTQTGPHRADIRVRIAGHNAADTCSRGELKVLAWAMVLSQGRCFQQSAERTASLTYLVDDLAAELDGVYREGVSRMLAAPENQVFITGIEPSQLDIDWGQPNRQPPKLFHVEQGSFHEQETSA